MKRPYSATEDYSLTLEELRNIPGFENVTDEYGQQVRETMAVLCEILFSIYINQKNATNNPNSAECDLRVA